MFLLAPHLITDNVLNYHMWGNLCHGFLTYQGLRFQGISSLLRRRLILAILNDDTQPAVFDVHTTVGCSELPHIFMGVSISCQSSKKSIRATQMAELGHFRPGRAYPRQRCGVHFGEVRAPGGGGSMRQESTWEQMESGKQCQRLARLWK